MLLYHSEPASSKEGNIGKKNDFLFLFCFSFYSQFGFHGHSRWKPEQVYNHLGELRVREQFGWNPRVGLQKGTGAQLSLRAKETPGNLAEIAQWDIWYGISECNEGSCLSGCKNNPKQVFSPKPGSLGHDNYMYEISQVVDNVNETQMGFPTDAQATQNPQSTCFKSICEKCECFFKFLFPDLKVRFWHSDFFFNWA